MNQNEAMYINVIKTTQSHAHVKRYYYLLSMFGSWYFEALPASLNCQFWVVLGGPF